MSGSEREQLATIGNRQNARVVGKLDIHHLGRSLITITICLIRAQRDYIDHLDTGPHSSRQFPVGLVRIWRYTENETSRLAPATISRAMSEIQFRRINHVLAVIG